MTELAKVELHILRSGEEAAQAKAKFVATLAEECIGVRGKFTIALSGGSTPRRLYQILASPPHAEGIAWDRWHIFWSDERCVPPDHEDSSFRMAREAWLDQVPIPPAQDYRMWGEVAPQDVVLPAARVRPTQGTVDWFLTEEAASVLRTKNGV